MLRPLLLSFPNSSRVYEPGFDIYLATKSAPLGTFAFAANGVGGTISRCWINATGGFYDCGLVGDFTNPYGLAIQGKRLFMADFGAGSVIKCEIDMNNGNLTDCNTAGSGFTGPIDMAFTESRVYVTNGGNGSVSLCDFSSSSGHFSSCRLVAQGWGNENCYGIALNNGYSYVSMKARGFVRKCTVLANGDFANCAENPVSFFQKPFGIIPWGSKYMFVAEENGNAVSSCEIRPSDGQLVDCKPQAPTSFKPIYLATTGRVVYISDIAGNEIEKCEADPYTGKLTSCTPTGSGFNIPLGIAIM